MPYHPDHHLRPAGWQIVTVALLIGLLVGALIWSFQVGRQQQLVDEPVRGTAASPAVRRPATPEPPGRPVP